MVNPAVPRVRFLFRILFFVLLLLPAMSVGAQPLVPIEIGDSVTGTLSPSEPSLRYAFQLESPQQIEIRIFAVSGGLIPGVRLLGPTGTVLASSTNPTGDDQIEVEASVGRGIHQIIVEGINGTTGQFLVLVESGAPAVPPVPLIESVAVTAQIDLNQPMRVYSFSGGAEDMLVYVSSGLTLSGPVVTLKEAESGETLGMSGAKLVGAYFRVPVGAIQYALEVSSGGSGGAEPFTVCLARASTAGACQGFTPAVVTAPTRTPASIVVISTQSPAPTNIPSPTVQPSATLAPLPPSAICIAGSLTGNLVNVRAEPNINTPIVTTLTGLNVANVIGRLGDNSWYRVSANGQTGWMAASVVRLGGPCQSIPVVSLTPVAPTPTITPVATTGLTLNPSGAPTYGSVSLAGGFLPDPHQVIITSGGPVDVSYLGCVGFAAQNPDYVVNFDANISIMLRFYFVGTADTTMIIRAPNGSFSCVDDSYGTSNPTVNFNPPVSGTYAIWVANYVAGPGVSGTLSITENDVNHP